MESSWVFWEDDQKYHKVEDEHNTLSFGFQIDAESTNSKRTQYKWKDDFQWKLI